MLRTKFRYALAVGLLSLLLLGTWWYTHGALVGTISAMLPALVLLLAALLNRFFLGLALFLCIALTQMTFDRCAGCNTPTTILCLVPFFIFFLVAVWLLPTAYMKRRNARVIE